MLDHLRGLIRNPLKVLVWMYYAWRFTVARLIRRRSGSAFFTPEQPRLVYSVWKICRELGLRVTETYGSDCVMAFSWEDTTVNRQPPAAPPLGRPRLINERCVDIRKSTVEAASIAAFGYGLAVDPRTHVGRYVRKSEENAVHDGTLIEGPREPEAGYVYQQLVDNVVDGDRVVDVRVPIVGRRIPFVYLRHRSERERFTQLHDRTEMRSTASVLAVREIELLLDFCALIGLEFGELDVLRDRHDGRIHVVDANKTPGGPPLHAPFWLGVRANRILARAVAQEFLADRGQQPTGRDVR
ncbi:MAG: hypothetical protein IVW53_04845 [Chloroflexi bacterium]|nr:hypothetical protein [Chloroflexota bacterium]